MKRLLLFAKRPLLGRVKTRLVPPLKPEQSLALYRAFLADQIEFLRTLGDGYDIELCMDGAWVADPTFDPPLDGLRQCEQGPGDLGERMLRAFQRCWREGAECVVVLGADSPTLPAAHIHGAFRALERGAAAVLAPATDGGYVLLGLRRPLAELFRKIPWGTSGVLEITRLRAEAGGTELSELAPWYDVDDIEGLRRLQRELGRPGAVERAPATARLLATLDLTHASML